MRVTVKTQRTDTYEFTFEVDVPDHIKDVDAYIHAEYESNGDNLLHAETQTELTPVDADGEHIDGDGGIEDIEVEGVE